MCRPLELRSTQTQVDRGSGRPVDGGRPAAEGTRCRGLRVSTAHGVCETAPTNEEQLTEAVKVVLSGVLTV